MAKDKIKLTFRRAYKFTRLDVNYTLEQMENAVCAACDIEVEGTNRVRRVLYRVGDNVPEEHVQIFVESKRDYEVKVKS
jgi:hypothetical protein